MSTNRAQVDDIGFRDAVVVGLGLIGGSLARELAARGVRVRAVERDRAALAAAMDEGVVSEAFDPSNQPVPTGALVVLAQPVDAIAHFLDEHSAALEPAALVTDVGSTKRRIVERAERIGLGPKFVGAHPIAGDHRSGWGASRTGLFAGAEVLLCSGPTLVDEVLDQACTLWSALGARPRTIDAEAHDRQLAWSSHLPQAVATILARTLAGAGISQAELGPGGRDTTRLAASDPEMWGAIACDNAHNLDDALAEFQRVIARFRAALVPPDRAALQAHFAAGRRWTSDEHHG